MLGSFQRQNLTTYRKNMSLLDRVTYFLPPHYLTQPASVLGGKIGNPYLPYVTEWDIGDINN